MMTQIFMLCVVLFLLPILFRLAIKLRLGIPMLYIALALTVFHDWVRANPELADGVLFAHRIRQARASGECAIDAEGLWR